MSDFLEAMGLESNSSDPVMAAINGAEQTDDLRSIGGIDPGGDNPDTEGLMPMAEDDPGSLLLPQKGPGVSIVNGGNKASGKSSEVGKDPLTGNTGDSTVGEMDALTDANADGGEIETRARKRDKAGNNMRKARNFGALTGDERFKEFVGKSDRKDFYKFKVNKRTAVDIDLRGLSDNADLYLRNSKGRLIEKSTKGGKRSESIDETLNKGTYYLEVRAKGKNDNTNYNLTVKKKNVKKNNTRPPLDLHAEPIVINKVDTASDLPASKDDPGAIDLMVVYTPEALQAEGGAAGMSNLIQTAVNNTNVAFANSGVQTKLNLVHTAQVNYSESGKSSTELNRLQNPADGYMDEVHQLRDQYGADIVSLFVGNMNDAGGIGYLMQTPSYSFEDHAFNVVMTEYAASRNTLAHEIGHNLGLAHDREHAGGQGAFPYGYGYTTPSGVGTIMSYADNRVNYFSNPTVSYNGEAIGRDNSEYSALAINQVAEYAANWRESKQNPNTTTTTQGSITVLSPNGAESFKKGETLNITWNDNIAENVIIGLFKGESPVLVLADSTESDGSYSWTIPLDVEDGSDYAIGIQSTSDPTVNDLSNTSFSIVTDNTGGVPGGIFNGGIFNTGTINTGTINNGIINNGTINNGFINNGTIVNNPPTNTTTEVNVNTSTTSTSTSNGGGGTATSSSNTSTVVSSGGSGSSVNVSSNSNSSSSSTSSGSSSSSSSSASASSSSSVIISNETPTVSIENPGYYGWTAVSPGTQQATTIPTSDWPDFLTNNAGWQNFLDTMNNMG